MKNSRLAGILLALFLLGGWPVFFSGALAGELAGAASSEAAQKFSGWDGSAITSPQVARVRIRPGRVRLGRGGGGLFGITTYAIFEASSHATFGSTSQWMFDAEDSARRERQLAPFVVANFDRIGQEMAAGGGEHVEILAGLLGCPASRRADFARWSRANFGRLFPDSRDDPARLIQLLTAGSTTRGHLGGSCRVAG